MSSWPNCSGATVAVAKTLKTEAHREESAFRKVQKEHLLDLLGPLDVRGAVRVEHRLKVGPIEPSEAVRHLPLHVELLALLWCQVARELALQPGDLCKRRSVLHHERIP